LPYTWGKFFFAVLDFEFISYLIDAMGVALFCSRNWLLAVFGFLKEIVAK